MTAAQRWSARWHAFLNPLHGEKRRVLEERWRSLPTELQTRNQVSGRHLTHCGFITGASYCSFHCTHCYLPKNANEVPIPSFEEMKEAIDANRRFQGPGGGLQITGGDVADAYWRSGRQQELVDIIRYAYSTGLVPMLMTHGQTLIEHPEFLEQLMVEGGLRQVAVHIDVTQAGRRGYPIQRVRSEADLHPIREQFTELGWKMREKTGLPLEFAHNCTVTRKNIDGVAEIIRWFLADPKRTVLWRMLSFQPEADTGRTLYSEEPITPTLAWEKIREGVNLAVRRDGTIFGHPDCNSWTSLLVSQESGEYTTLLPEDDEWQALFGEALSRMGGLSLVTDDAGTAPFRLFGVIFRSPWLAARMVAHFIGHVAGGRTPKSVLASALKGKVHTVGVGIHNFMDASMVARADTDSVIKSRLDSCVFKGAVKEKGEWVAVPMCKMNQAKWSEVYDARVQNPVLRAMSQANSPDRRGAKPATSAPNGTNGENGNGHAEPAHAEASHEEAVPS